MAGDVLEKLVGADNSVLKVHDGKRLFPLSRNIQTQEKKNKKSTPCNLWASRGYATRLVDLWRRESQCILNGKIDR